MVDMRGLGPSYMQRFGCQGCVSTGGTLQRKPFQPFLQELDTLSATHEGVSLAGESWMDRTLNRVRGWVPFLSETAEQQFQRLERELASALKTTTPRELPLVEAAFSKAESYKLKMSSVVDAALNSIREWAGRAKELDARGVPVSPYAL